MEVLESALCVEQLQLKMFKEKLKKLLPHYYFIITMSNNTYFIRDYTKYNLADDLIEVFPKLKNIINVPRSDGTFTPGGIVRSTLMQNQYAMFNTKYNGWFLQTYFYDMGVNLTFKVISIDDLEYSNFSKEEIQTLNDALTKGVRIQLDFTKISPVLHPINHNINEFDKMFTKQIDANPNFDPNTFLNFPPPLKL